MRNHQMLLIAMLIVGAVAVVSPAAVQGFDGDALHQTMRVMQRCLTSLGYDTGGVTGRWNTQTEIMAYRYASSKSLNPYIDGYQVGQVLLLDCPPGLSNSTTRPC